MVTLFVLDDELVLLDAPPSGERVEIDLARPATGIDESTAREYIERIAQGQPLLADFVRKLFSL